ncbi:MAG: lytic murein transglycosylase [Acidobacteria bacterium]|nr:lytic murein transglycosylase [Acidobacteriota bacterium]
MMHATFAFFLMLNPSVSERVTYVVDQLTQTGFSRREAEAFFQNRRLKTYPEREVAPRKIDWDSFIANLVSRESVQRGTTFLSRNHAVLSAAEERFGVPKEVLSGLVRVETNFGQNTGNYVTFNVFYTQLIRSEAEARWKRAADNLVSLATYCKRLRKNCFRIKGSYGGAIGFSQFLPHTLETYGADGNGDGKVDVFQWPDAIFSAANFLVEHGWHTDKLVALGKYYGSPEGYPRAVLAYTEALQKE